MGVGHFVFLASDCGLINEAAKSDKTDTESYHRNGATKNLVLGYHGGILMTKSLRFQTFRTNMNKQM